MQSSSYWGAWGLIIILSSALCAQDSISKTRLPVPSTSEQSAAGRILAERYQVEYKAARTRTEKQQLGRKLLAEIATTKAPAERFVLANVAGKLAVQIRDVRLAMDSVAQTAGAFEVDELRLKGQRLHMIFTAGVEGLEADFCREAFACAVLAKQQQKTYADQFLSLGERVAKSTKDPKLLALLEETRRLTSAAEAMVRASEKKDEVVAHSFTNIAALRGKQVAVVEIPYKFFPVKVTDEKKPKGVMALREAPDGFADGLFMSGKKAHQGRLNVKVKSAGVVVVVVNTSTQEDRRLSGGPWKKELQSISKLRELGWTEVTPLNNGSSLALYKHCKAGEEFYIRTRKYHTPQLVLPGSMVNDGNVDATLVAKAAVPAPAPPNNGAADSAHDIKPVVSKDSTGIAPEWLHDASGLISINVQGVNSSPLRHQPKAVFALLFQLICRQPGFIDYRDVERATFITRGHNERSLDPIICLVIKLNKPLPPESLQKIKDSYERKQHAGKEYFVSTKDAFPDTIIIDRPGIVVLGFEHDVQDMLEVKTAPAKSQQLTSKIDLRAHVAFVQDLTIQNATWRGVFRGLFGSEFGRAGGDSLASKLRAVPEFVRTINGSLQLDGPRLLNVEVTAGNQQGQQLAINILNELVTLGKSQYQENRAAIKSAVGGNDSLIQILDQFVNNASVTNTGQSSTFHIAAPADWNKSIELLAGLTPRLLSQSTKRVEQDTEFAWTKYRSDLAGFEAEFPNAPRIVNGVVTREKGIVSHSMFVPIDRDFKVEWEKINSTAQKRIDELGAKEVCARQIITNSNLSMRTLQRGEYHGYETRLDVSVHHDDGPETTSLSITQTWIGNGKWYSVHAQVPKEVAEIARAERFLDSFRIFELKLLPFEREFRLWATTRGRSKLEARIVAFESGQAILLDRQNNKRAIQFALLDAHSQAAVFRFLVKNGKALPKPIRAGKGTEILLGTWELDRGRAYQLSEGRINMDGPPDSKHVQVWKSLEIRPDGTLTAAGTLDRKPIPPRQGKWQVMVDDGRSVVLSLTPKGTTTPKFVVFRVLAADSPYPASTDMRYPGDEFAYPFYRTKRLKP